MLGAIAFRRDLFSEVEAKPDLYGPFWISTSVVFLLAMASNAVDWLASDSSEVAWQGDLDKVVYGAVILYGYVFGAGLVLWLWLKVISLAAISLSALWCIYGARSQPCPAALACPLCARCKRESYSGSRSPRCRPSGASTVRARRPGLLLWCALVAVLSAHLANCCAFVVHLRCALAALPCCVGASSAPAPASSRAPPSNSHLILYGCWRQHNDPKPTPLLPIQSHYSRVQATA